MISIRTYATVFIVALTAGCGSAAEPEASAGTAVATQADSSGPLRPLGAPVTGHPSPLTLLQSDDAMLAANKQLVFDMWRSIVNSGHVELAEQMLTEGYIQHSPLLPTGRAAFRTIFSAVPRRAEILPVVEPPIIAMVSEDDLVVMAFIESLQTPDRSENYTSTHFNFFRIDDGRLAEHWHSLQGPPGPDVLPPDRGGPQPVTGATGTAQLSLLNARSVELTNNKRLVFDLWRNVFDAGDIAAASRYVADDVIEHNPNVSSGISTFARYHGASVRQPVADHIDAPLVAIVAERDLVVVVSMHEHAHPHRAGATYTSTWFDMFRIEDGRVAEHWDPAMLPGSPAPFGGEP